MDLSKMNAEELEELAAKVQAEIEARAESSEETETEDAAEEGAPERPATRGPSYDREPKPPIRAKGGPDKDGNKGKGDGLNPLERVRRSNETFRETATEGFTVKR